MGTGITITVGGNDITAYCKVETLRIEEMGTQDVATAYFKVEDHSGTVSIAGKDAVDIRPTGGAAATILFAGEVGRVVKGQRGITKTWEVHCQDNNVLLDERTIPSASYVATTADSAIIDDLFTNYRSDINSTDEVDTINASMEALEFEEMTLRECLDAICAITGGRYYVDYEKNLHYFNVETGNTASFGLSTSPDFSSTYPFSNFRETEDSTRLTTHVRVLGEDAEGWYPAAPDYSEDERHALVRDRSALNAAAVEDVGTAVYNRYSGDRETYRLATEQDGLRAGQSISLVNATWGINSTYWIRELKMMVLDKAGDKRRYDLILNDEAPSPARMARQRKMDTSAQVEVDITLSARGWGHDLTFSASDHDTVAWAGGTITLADGHTTYSIDAGNTGNMGALTYIYLDTDTSLTVLQTTTTAATSIGKVKILIAVAAPSGEAGKDATFQVFGGKGGVGVFITADNIAANTITANEITGNTITAAEIAGDTITAAEIAAATITGTEIAAATITADKLTIGEMVFDTSDGLLLLNPPLKVLQEGAGAATANYWYSKRGEKGRIGAAAAAAGDRGALHLVPGRWPGTQALVIDEATTNYLPYPSVESGDPPTGWNVADGAHAQSSSYVVHGDYSVAIDLNNVANARWYSDQTAAASFVENDACTFSIFLKGSGSVNLVIAEYSNVPAYLRETGGSTITLTDTWTRHELTVTCGVNCDRVNVRVRRVSGTPSFYADAAMVEKKDYATTYCDGSLGDGYSWSGVAHASTSTRVKSYVLLDDYVGLIASNNTMSFRLVVQAPYDHDAEWPGGDWSQYIMDARVAGDAANSYLTIRYNENVNRFAVIVGANNTILYPTEFAFSAGDWLDIIVTFDFTNDEYYFYVNGEEVDSATDSESPSAYDSWDLGCHYTEANIPGWAFAEFAVFDRVLTAVEVAQLYNLQRPLIDTGATDKPGIYILDGMFRILSQQTGNRIEITPDEIAGYDSTGTKQFYLQSSDGKAMAGGGVVELDADGIDIAISTAEADIRAYKFNLSGTVFSGLWAYAADAFSHVLNLQAKSIASRSPTVNIFSLSPATTPAYISIKALSGGDFAQILLTADSDAAVKKRMDFYGTLFDFNGKVYAESFSTDDGTTRWKLGARSVGAIVSTDGYVELDINGTTWKLMQGSFA